MIRNIILASFISTIAMFGALGSKDPKITLICLAMAFVTWTLCIWRCMILNQGINKIRERQRMFDEYLRRNLNNPRRWQAWTF